jgi:hypothetical protein
MAGVGRQAQEFFRKKWAFSGFAALAHIQTVAE